MYYCGITRFKSKTKTTDKELKTMIASGEVTIVIIRGVQMVLTEKKLMHYKK